MLYLGIFVGLVALIAVPIGSNARKFIYVVVLVSLFLFSAFRFEVGCDWLSYEGIFDTIGSRRVTAETWGVEYLWYLSTLIVYDMEWPYPSINILTSLLFFVGVHALARRQPDRLAFLVILFPVLVLNMPMSGIRQGAAIGLICIALDAFIRRRPISFTIWVALATGFHSSAIIFILLLPLSLGRYSWSRLAVTLLLAIPGAFALAQSDPATVAVSRYVESGLDAAGAVFRSGVLVVTALYFIIVLRRRWALRYPGDFPLASLGSMGMLGVGILVPISTVIADRLGYYLVPVSAMILARIPYLAAGGLRQIQILAPYVLLIGTLAIWVTLSSQFQRCYLPYQTWMFGFPLGYR